MYGMAGYFLSMVGFVGKVVLVFLSGQFYLYLVQLEISSRAGEDFLVKITLLSVRTSYLTYGITFTFNFACFMDRLTRTRVLEALQQLEPGEMILCNLWLLLWSLSSKSQFLR